MGDIYVAHNVVMKQYNRPKASAITTAFCDICDVEKWTNQRWMHKVPLKRCNNRSEISHGTFLSMI